VFLAVRKIEMNCPECGAPEILCQTRFEEFLALEFSDSGYLDVRTENAEVYCADVTAWARAVLEDVQELEI